MGNLNILIVHPGPDFHQEIFKGLSKLLLDKVNVGFSSTGHDACMKFNRVARSLGLILFNPNTPWIDDCRKVRCTSEDFLRHIKAPCQKYFGKIVLVSSTPQIHLPYETIDPDEVIEFISFFIAEKQLVQKSLA